MKFFACFVFAAAVFAVVSAQGDQEFVREKKSAYGPAPAPPCPKSVLVSCAPLVQKVPCKPGKPGPAGAYSEFVPQYAPYSEDYYNEY